MKKDSTVTHNTFPLHRHARMELNAAEALRTGHHEEHESVDKYDHAAMMSELISGLAHEIRNPVAGIRAAIQTLSRKVPVDDPTYPIYQNIFQTADRLEELTRVLLAYTRSGKPKFSKLEINPLIRDTIALFVQDKQDQVKIQLDLKDELPILLADERLLQQVLLNLFTNAFEAKKLSDLMLTISSHYLDRQHDANINLKGEELNPFHCHKGVIQIRVQDNGPGIPKKDLNNIFKPFYSTKEKGTGFGLYFSMQILRQHQGCLFASNVKGGTAFTLCLPITMK